MGLEWEHVTVSSPETVLSARLFILPTPGVYNLGSNNYPIMWSRNLKIHALDVAKKVHNFRFCRECDLRPGKTGLVI